MAIIAASVVPNPPALLPTVTGRPITEIEHLRALATAAVQWVLDAAPDELVLVGAGPTMSTLPPAPASTGAAYRGETGPNPALPLALDVAVSLLPAEPDVPVIVQSVATDASPAAALELGASLSERGARIGLVVAGDGSARRGPKAPGYDDPRSRPFDEVVERAFRAGDATMLAELDPMLAAELLVAGRAAWQVLAGAVGARAVAAQVDYADDPFGVQYFVARWQIR